MESRILDGKLQLLGYEVPSDYVSSFEVLVLKLEEEQIRHYDISQRAELMSNNKGIWTKCFIKYCNRLNIPVSRGLYNGGQITHKGKVYLLNELLNLAIKEKYQDCCEEKAIIDELKPIKVHDNSCDELYSKVVKINSLLFEDSLPSLDNPPRSSEIKSAIRFFKSLKLAIDSNNLKDAGKCSIVLKRAPQVGMEAHPDVSTVLKLLYTFELRKFQAEMIWLTKIIQMK